MIDLIGKTVKVNDPDDLLFFYPTFEKRTHLVFTDVDKNILYVGKMKSNLLRNLQVGTKAFINTAGMHDYDFTDREFLLKFVFSKWNKEPPKYLAQTHDSFDDDEFMYCCKVYWVCGRWPYRVDEGVTLFDLFKGSVDSVKDMLKVFFELQTRYPFYVIESSFITFINRSMSIEDQNVSPAYLRLLKTFNSKSSSKIKPAILEYAQSKIKNEELKFIDFILNLR